MGEPQNNSTYLCSCCGKEHTGVPFSFAADFPDPYANLNKDGRDARAIIGSDQCIIDQQQFYLRGCLEIPIVGTDQVFLWGLWATLWEHDFDEIAEYWDSEGRQTRIGPYKARLANTPSLYPETFNLTLSIRIMPVGERPLFVVDDLDHPLGTEQRNGISLDKAQEYACLLLRMAGR